MNLVEAEKVERNSARNKNGLNLESDSNSITSFGSADYAGSHESSEDNFFNENQANDRNKPGNMSKHKAPKFVSAFQEETKL